MEKKDVLEKLLSEAKALSQAIPVIEGFKKDATQTRLALESTNEAIADIAKTLEK